MEKLSKKIIIVFIVTALAVLVQIAGLDNPHLSPLPARVECNMLLSRTTLDDGSSLLVDTQGKRLLFTNQEGQLIRVVEFSASNNTLSSALEVSVSSEGDTYLVHGVKAINYGNYLSSESVLTYDSAGNCIEKTLLQTFSDSEYVASVDYLYGKPRINQLFSLLDESFSIDYSPMFFLECLIFALSLVWLVVMLFVLIAWIIKTKRYEKAKIALVALVCVCVTVCFYTANNFQKVKEKFEQNAVIVSGQVANMLSANDIVYDLEELTAMSFDAYISDSAHREGIEQLNKYVNELSMAYGKEQSISVLIFSVSTDKTYRVIAVSGDSNFIGQENSYSDKQRQLLLNNIGGVVRMSTPLEDAILSARPIMNDKGEVIAVVSVESNVDNILVSQISESFDLFINLLAILICLYFAFVAIKMCVTSIRSCIRQKDFDVSNRIVHLSGMYMLIYKFAYNVDNVFVVYIAMSLCQGMDPATQAFYVAIPVSAYYAGQWIGTFFATPLLKVFGERTTALFMCVISAIVMFFTGWSVVMGSIVLYSIGRGLMGAAVSGVLYVVSDTLPFYAKTKEQRTKAIESSMIGSTVAAVLISLVGGYVSQYAGYFFIYVMGAALCVALFAMTIFTFGKKTQATAPHVKETTEKKSSYRELWSIFLKPELLIYILCFAVPNLLVGGYSSYLFPLIASGAGVSTVLLANINVFCFTAMYLSQNTLRSFTRRFSPSMMLVVPSLLICVGLICFILSPTIYWAIIMVFVVGVFNYMTNIAKKNYLIEVSEAYHRDAALVQSNYYTIDSALQIVRSPALSVFVALGASFGCIVLGGVCGIMFSVMGIYTRTKTHIKGVAGDGSR